MSKLKANLVDSYARVVSAYLENNQVGHDEFTKLLRPIQQAMNEEEQPGFEVIDHQENMRITDHRRADAPTEQAGKQREPKSPQEIEESISDHHIYSFIDGKPYKTLKRHIGTHGYDERSYRLHFGLPADYPMVHPAYAQARSDLSKKLGLGKKKEDRPAAAKETAKARPNPKPSAKNAKAMDDAEQPDV